MSHVRLAPPHRAGGLPRFICDKIFWKCSSSAESCMKKYFSFLAIVSFCFLGACSAPQKFSSVVPGQSVGAVRLGMTASQVKGMFGEPRVGAKLQEGASYTYPSAGLNIVIGSDTRVRR